MSIDKDIAQFIAAIGAKEPSPENENIERGDFTDVLWQLGLVGTFGLAVGSITGALVAGEKVARSAGC
jgi:hypothetical protein